jgi:hypothetical protein
MSLDNRRLNELIIPIAVIPSLTGAQASVESGWVDMNDHRQVLAVLNGGVYGTTIDLKLQQATSSSGTAKKDISGKAITQIVANDKVATIECSNYELDADNSFTFLAMDITTVGATAAAGCMLYGGPKDKYQPGTTISVEDVGQTIT